jgi:flagellar secretion chaperone FliS
MQQRVNAYNRVHVNTSTNKAAMLLELYEGAIRFIDFAEKVMQARNIARKGEYISRAIAIIGELDSALDRKGGGSIVWNLSELYGYMIQRLTIGNRTQDPVILREVKGLLESLLDAWRAAARELEGQTNALNEQAPEPQMPQRQYGGACVA